MKYAIIVVGYNRINTIQRLLKSIGSAYYSCKVDLIISIDHSDVQDELIRIANTYQWPFGEKIVRFFETRQGLRNHIMQCGDYTSIYDAIIVLEDDLIVAKGFFEYAKQAVDRYKDDVNIAGISLYSHKSNPGNGRFFTPQFNGFDVYFHQYAQSWGQCWTREMWEGFRKWYDNHMDRIEASADFPDYILSWNDNSWLKYHIKYTIETNKYFIYPYHSLSTNSSSVGEHSSIQSPGFQVPLQQGVVNMYRFPSVGDAIKYDAFFERVIDASFLIQDYDNILLDLYGLRQNYGEAKYLFSVNSLPYKVIKEFALQYSPIELNCIYQESGKGLFLYDLETKDKTPKRNINSIALYEFKAQSGRLTAVHFMNRCIQRLFKHC